MTDKERRYELMAKALEIENDSDMIKTIVENVANITIEDINNHNGEFEIFAKPSGITGKELDNLQELFRVKEIGVYGDPNLPEDDIYFHMIVYVNY